MQDISYSIAATIIDLVLVLIVSLRYSNTNLVSKRFRYFLFASIAMFAFDMATAATNYYYQNIPVWLNTILNSLYFFTSGTVAILFLYYCVSVALKDESMRMRKNLYIVNVSLLGAYTLILILNGFLGFFFSFPGGVYTHGDLYLGINLFSILYVLESIFFFIYRYKKFKRSQIVCTALFFALFFASFFVQLFAFPNVLLTDFGIALGALIVFFSIETPDYVKLMATLNELNELKASLEIQVQNRTAELQEEKKSYEELTLETLSSLAHVIDAKDHYTIGHSFRVAAYAKGIADELGLTFTESQQIYFAGLIHDVGKIGINESILTKPGKLSPEEFVVIQSHSSLGGDILRGIKEFPVFEQVARSHHERFDGHGYPDKLAGESIPFGARIVAVADTFDAMTSDRSYRKALSDQVAMKELKDCSGTQFDPQMVEAFFRLCEKFPDSIRNHVEDIASEVEEKQRAIQAE